MYGYDDDVTFGSSLRASQKRAALAQDQLWARLGRQSPQRSSSGWKPGHTSRVSPIDYTGPTVTYRQLFRGLLILGGTFLAIAGVGAALGYVFLSPYLHSWPNWSPMVVGAAGSLGAAFVLSWIIGAIGYLVKNFRDIVTDLIVFLIKIAAGAIILIGLYYALVYYAGT